MKTLNILSGGAAQGLVRSLEPAFEAETGLGIAGDFGAVGAMADRLRAGVPTAIVILTAALIAKLLAQIDIADVIADRLRVFPNGATAMRYLAESNDRRPIGCTQSTEIISTKGVILSGPLPPGCGLATMYTAAIPAHVSSASPAQRLIALLTSSATSERRSQAGFISGLTS